MVGLPFLYGTVYVCVRAPPCMAACWCMCVYTSHPCAYRWLHATTNAYIHTHTRIHNHTATHDCIHAHTYTYTHMHASNHTHMHTVRAAGTYVGIHSCMQVMASWHTNTYMHASVHPCIQAHMHAQFHKRLRSGMNATMHAYTNAPTHSIEYNMHAFPCACVGVSIPGRHACMHTHMHSCSHKHICVHGAMHTSSCTPVASTHKPTHIPHTHIQAAIRVSWHTIKHTHTHMHARRKAHTHTCQHCHTHIQPPSQPPTHPYRRTSWQGGIPTCIHATT